MEEKAKRVGRFNIVDIIAVILMIAVAAFVGWKLLGPDDSIGAERAMTKVTFVVKVEGVPAELYENCVNHLPSPLMASGALVGGEIVAVEQEPYYVLSAGGEWIEDEEHTTLLFTAVTQTPTAEVMTTKVGDQEVRIGKTDYILKSEYMEFAAQMTAGAAKLVLSSGQHPGALKDAVCSPGGTTIQGVRALEAAGLRSAVIEAVLASYEKNFDLK